MKQPFNWQKTKPFKKLINKKINIKSLTKSNFSKDFKVRWMRKEVKQLNRWNPLVFNLAQPKRNWKMAKGDSMKYNPKTKN